MGFLELGWISCRSAHSSGRTVSFDPRSAAKCSEAGVGSLRGYSDLYGELVEAPRSVSETVSPV